MGRDDPIQGAKTATKITCRIIITYMKHLNNTVRFISAAKVLATTDLLLLLVRILNQVQKAIDTPRIRNIYIQMNLGFSELCRYRCYKFLTMLIELKFYM